MESFGSQRPNVSICTLTHNRSRFLKRLQGCIERQTYPLEKIEWVILDDSNQYSGSIELSTPTPITIKYQRINNKLTLGGKRNLSHRLCSGEILIYMDDDDYYFPERVEHAVHQLVNNNRQMAGSTTLPIFFLEDDQLWISGPFGNNHATAGTFAMTKEFSLSRHYDNSATCNEEKSFLNEYQTDIIQLDPNRTMICISHDSNTFDKRRMRSGGENPRMKRAPKNLERYARELLEKSGFIGEAAKKISEYNSAPQSATCENTIEKFRIAGINAKTDKIEHHHYERYLPMFTGIRDNDRSILEIGYGDGSSIRFWHEIFPKSSIVVLDIDREEASSSHQCIRCDASKPSDIFKAISLTRAHKFDLIVDDGSHVPSHQITAFNLLFRYSLAHGGSYIIEDIETSFWKSGSIYGYDVAQDMKGDRRKLFDAMRAACEFVNREFLTEDELLDLKRRLSSFGLDTGVCHEISSISFGHNCISIQKARSKDCKVLNRKYRLSKCTHAQPEINTSRQD